MIELIINSEFRDLIPPLGVEELKGLEHSIIENGCNDSIKIWNNTIIDGHHRYKICTKNNVEFETKSLDFNDKLDVKFWMINNQFDRRNITKYVRAELALKLKSFYTDIGRKNMAAGGEGLLNSANLDTREEIAKKANVGHDTINKVERINEALEKNPDAEIKDQLISGEISINQAFNNVVKNEPIVSKFTGNNEWYTPSEYIESARVVMGSIDLDPASNKISNKIVKAETYYTLENSGLDHEWRGNVWLNPPYSGSEIKQFIDKFRLELKNINQAIILTNNNTDTIWWHYLADQADGVLFTKGRIQFYNDTLKSSPTNGQTFFYFGNKINDFNLEFQQYGLIWA